jgi:hypothetical protein
VPARTQPLLEREVLERLYFDQGLSIQKVADRTGTNARLVRDSFTAHGMTWRSRSESMTGIVRSSETRAKISAARIGKKDSPEVAAKKRDVLRRVNGWGAGLTKHTDARVARAARAFAKVARTPAYRAKMSRIATRRLRTTGGGFARGYHESPKAGRVFYMSSWELLRFQELDSDPAVLMYKPQPCSIPYPWEEATKHYTPDILVIYEGRTPELEEIKPRRVIENDKSGRVAARLSAGRQFAAQRGWPFRLIDRKPERKV